MKRRLCIFLLMALVMGTSGCKSVFKTRWQNFNAYYNTFYNAEKNYEVGYQKVSDATTTINPEQPLRIHRTPTTVGDADFEKAILKGADVLREYPQSKWVDDALLLIGKSYFNQGKFFSADQKFQELLVTTKSNPLKQEAIKWRGLYFLETEQYSEGIEYLNAQLFDEELDWRRAEEAAVRLVLGELYVAIEQWDSAEEQLVQGLERARGKSVNANGWFLLGQVRERLDMQEEALAAYSRVARYNPEYAMVYHAKRKQAEISRNMGRHERALALFSDMSRDDKNFDEMAELYYEIARSYQEIGDFRRAERYYYDVLNYTIKAATPETKAKTYYGLAEISRDHYGDYLEAAAYFDSASTAGNDLTRLPDWFDAREKSMMFNTYKQLAMEAYETDSLLWVSSLSQEAFDSLLVVVRRQKMEQLREERRRQQAAANTMVNLAAGQQQQTQGTSGSGFLNHKNPTLASQAKESFRAIWGDRPLVDNWRRLEAVRLAREDPALAGTEGEVQQEAGAVQEEEVTIDLSKIPFTDEERAKSRETIAAKIYEIGNVFFLQMDLADSAEANYRSVIDRFPDLPVSAQAMYSLSELHTVQGDSVGAYGWAERLVAEYPQTIYRNRVAERFPNRITAWDAGMTREDSLRTGFADRIRQVRDSLSVQNIEALREYSAEEFDYPLAPEAMYLAAQKYIELAKQDSVYLDHEPKFAAAEKEWDLKEREFTAMKDSAQTVLADTSLALTVADSSLWVPWVDSTFKRATFPEIYPYVGALWDSSRAVLQQWQVAFPTHAKKELVTTLSQGLVLPPYVVAYLDSVNRKPEPTADSLNALDERLMMALGDSIAYYHEQFTDSLGVLPDSILTIVDSFRAQMDEIGQRKEQRLSSARSASIASADSANKADGRLASALADSIGLFREMYADSSGVLPDSVIQVVDSLQRRIETLDREMQRRTAMADSIRAVISPPSIVADSTMVAPPDTLQIPPDSTVNVPIRPPVPDSAASPPVVPPDTSVVMPPDTLQIPVQPPQTPQPVFLPDGRRVHMCYDLNIALEAVEDLDVFVNSLELQKAFEGQPLRGELRFRVRIDEEGKPMEVGVNQAPEAMQNVGTFMAAAIKEQLTFKPVTDAEGKPAVVECEFILVLEF